MSISEEIISKMEEILLNKENIVEGRHSFFQLQHFVINGQPTTQSRMWQCVRELRKRYNVVKQIDLEVEETKDNISILDLEIKKIDIRTASLLLEESELAKVERELNSVKKRQLERRKTSLQQLVKNCETSRQEQLDEGLLFLKSLEALEKIEPLKPFDDPESQRQYWNGKLTNELNLKLLLQQPIDIEMAKTIMALPNDVPIKNQLTMLFAQIQNVQNKVNERSPARKIEAK